MILRQPTTDKEIIRPRKKKGKEEKEKGKEGGTERSGLARRLKSQEPEADAGHNRRGGSP